MPAYTRNALYEPYKRPPVGGYRKTPRRQRTDSVPAAYRIRFILPGNLGFGRLEGPIPGALGARILSIFGHVVVEISGGKSWAQLQALAIATKFGLTLPLAAEITKDHETPTDTMLPYRRGDAHVAELGPRQVVEGLAMRALV